MFQKFIVVGVVCVLLFAGLPVGFGQAPDTRDSLADPWRVPDPTLTPGATLPVTATDICVPGYSGKVRNVPMAVRRQVWAAYGLPPQPGRGWELDHLVSLELGGSNSPRNLWPEPGAGSMNYHNKDRLENKLHADVCSNQMPLVDAQRAIAHDWELAYHQYVEGD